MKYETIETFIWIMCILIPLVVLRLYLYNVRQKSIKEFNNRRELKNQPNIFNIEDIIKNQIFRNRINNLRLENIILLEKGKPVEISEKAIEEFKNIGLNNIDFFLGKYYNKPTIYRVDDINDPDFKKFMDEI